MQAASRRLKRPKLAKQYGIRIYTVGIGKKGPVPYPNSFGGYSLGETAMDEELLKQIAEMTGGSYFLATEKKALESIYKQIDTLEKQRWSTPFILLESRFFNIL